jgi:ketosteroid isomerase-like protein
MIVAALAAVVFMLSVAGVAAGQVVAVTSNNDPVSVMSAGQLAALSPIEKEVVAVDAAWATAYRTCDAKLMDSILHDDIMFIHAHARVDTKPILMKAFACTAPRDQAFIQPLRVVMTNPDTAVLEGAMTLGSLAQPITSLITRVYVRQRGAWRLIAHQTTRNPGVAPDGKPLPNPIAQPTR